MGSTTIRTQSYLALQWSGTEVDPSNLCMKHSSFRRFGSVIALTLLVIGFQNCAETGTMTNPSTADRSVLAAYPNIESVEPSGSFLIDGDWLRCMGECTINFHASSPALGNISSVVCEGDLNISDNKIACSNNLSISATD